MRVVDIFKLYEDEAREYSFLIDVRFFKELPDECKQKLDSMVGHFDNLPQDTYSFRDDAKPVQQDLIEILDRYSLISLVTLLEKFCQELHRIA